jgi:ATP-dependent exoDNAse (exonuclease V) alpha subunit
MGDNILKCKVLTGPTAGQIDYISKMKLKHGEGKCRSVIKFQRFQFPIRPCFAMTVNKSQGQTLKRVGLALDRQQCFGHGQVYVALSRVTRKDGIKVKH